MWKSEQFGLGLIPALNSAVVTELPEQVISMQVNGGIDLCADMCIDMSVDVCTDMFVDMCTAARAGDVHAGAVHMQIDICVDMCIGTCIGTCTDMCIDMCLDMYMAGPSRSPSCRYCT